MTIEKWDKGVTGAEAIDVVCNNCRTKVGEKILYSQHNGYAGNFKPLNGEQINEAHKIAKEHDRLFKFAHAIRIMIWRAE